MLTSCCCCVRRTNGKILHYSTYIKQLAIMFHITFTLVHNFENSFSLLWTYEYIFKLTVDPFMWSCEIIFSTFFSLKNVRGSCVVCQYYDLNYCRCRYTLYNIYLMGIATKIYSVHYAINSVNDIYNATLTYILNVMTVRTNIVH